MEKFNIKKIFSAFLGIMTLLIFSGTAHAQCPPGAVCETYEIGPIQTDRDFTSMGDTSACPGVLTVTIPSGHWVDSIATSYDMTADGGSWMNEMRSWLYSPTLNAGEPVITEGEGGNSSGTESYSRGGITFANQATGTFHIEFHAGRTFGGSGCDASIGKVDSATWEVIVYHSAIPTCPGISGLTTTDIFGTSVDLTWTEVGTANEWEVEYGPAGYTAGSGTSAIATSKPFTITGLSGMTLYDVYVRSICSAGDTSNWSGPATFETDFACPPEAFCFTNAGATGATGPTQAQLDAAYGGQPLVQSVNGYQEWMVPQGGEYKITVFGAEGGGANTAHRGQGGKAEGRVNFNGGELLYITVGQAGQYGHDIPSPPEGGFGGGGNGGEAGVEFPTYHGSSGGGASDVRINDTTLASRLIVGAGGGGGTGDGNETWRAAGGGGGGGGYFGGGGGQGGDESPQNAGEGGTQTAGGTGGGTAYGNTDGGPGFGGNGGNSTYDGSFDSNANQYGGDGGGLTGQDGNDDGLSTRAAGGGGGSSYLGGTATYALTDTTTQTGTREGHGMVIIEPLFTIQYASNDAGVMSIDEPDIFCPGNQDVVVTIGNFGENQITSVDVHWTVNGTAQTSVTYTGTLDTLGGTGNITDQINLGSYTFTNAAYDIVAWTVDPNGQTDTVNDNDTAHATVQSSIPSPENLTITDYGMDFASFYWTGNLTSDEYVYVVVPSGAAPYTGTPVGVTEDSATATGLTSYAALDIYVAELCPGGTDTSAWTGPETVITGGPMSGTYTIGPDPAHNFPTFTMANQALNTFGMAGAVDFEVAPGTYNEQIIIHGSIGTSATNTLTFKGAGADQTILSFEQNNSNERYTVRFDSASHVTFDSLTIKAEDGGSYGWAVHIYDHSTDITIQNSHIITEVTSSSSNLGVVTSGSYTSYTSSADSIHNITLENNYFEGGRTGIRMNGSSGDEVLGVEIRNNIMQYHDRNGIYFSRVDSFYIENNEISIHPDGSTFGGGVWMTNCSVYEIVANKIVNPGRYGIYATNAGGTATNRALIANNAISKIRNDGTLSSGIRMLNSGSEYIDVVYNTLKLDQEDNRAFNISNSSPASIRVLNNSFVFAGTGDGYAMYVSDESSIEEIDHNNYYSAGTEFVYYDSDRTDLADLQSVGTPANNDANSVSGDPLFTMPDLLIPMSPIQHEAGTPFAGITEDIEGNARSTTSPDMGAYEYTPIDDDLSLVQAEIVAGECLSANDSIYVSVVRTIGSAVDFSTEPLNVSWIVEGAANSSGSFTISSGTLAPGDTLVAGSDGVDMSEPGDYDLVQAYIDVTSINESAYNDTLHMAHYEFVPAMLQAQATPDTIYSPADTVELSAQSSFFPGGDVFITEICHWTSASTGNPPSWPSWLSTSIDYIEITGVPNMDLEGFTLEQWDESGLEDSYTFPTGTVLGPNGTAVIRIGSGSAVHDPANYHYDGVGGSVSWSSGNESGKIIKDPSGSIVDAVGYPGSSGSYTFPAAAGVTSAHWSGDIPAANGTSGIRLVGPHDHTATNWIVSTDSLHQTPNQVNPGVTVPSPTQLTDFEWTYNGAFLSDAPDTLAGPFTTSGSHQFVASYITPCGHLFDTVEIYMAAPTATTPIDTIVSCHPGDSITLEVDLTGTAPWNLQLTDGTDTIMVPDIPSTPFTYAVAPDQNTTYEALMVEDAMGWNYSDASVEVIMGSPPVVDLGPDSLFACANDSIILHGGTFQYYNWSTGETTDSIVVDSSGIGIGSQAITLTVTDEHGCTATDTVILSFVEYPVAHIIGPDSMNYNHQATYEAPAGYDSYLWSTGHTTQTVDLDSTHLNQGTNIISVTITNQYGCESTAEKEIYADPGTGILLHNENMHMSLYPNPNKGVFTLEIKTPENAFNLQILNVNGQLIAEESIEASHITKEYDLSHLTPGVYYIRVHNQNMAKTKKLIIK